VVGDETSPFSFSGGRSRFRAREFLRQDGSYLILSNKLRYVVISSGNDESLALDATEAQTQAIQ
jgi:hypothetical protein